MVYGKNGVFLMEICIERGDQQKDFGRYLSIYSEIICIL